MFQFIVPHLSYLCLDANWGVRKAVCEVFVEVARHTSPSVRRAQLAQTFVKLLHDPSRWVWYTAFQELGPFIATFANSKLSGLKIKDGQVFKFPSVCEADGRDPENVVSDMIDFDKLPAGCYLPEKETEEEEADDTLPGKTSTYHLIESFARLIDGLQHMLDTWTAGQKKTSTRSAPASVIISTFLLLKLIQFSALSFSEGEPSGSGEHVSIAAKCNSSDDLSKIGLDEGEYDEDDDVHLLDTTLNNFSLDDSTSSDEQDSTSEKKKSFQPSSANAPADFSELSYWSDSYDTFAEEDELIAFGSSKSVPNARSFLERRFDVLYVSPEQTITPVPSPRRTPHTSESERTSSEGDDMCTLSPNTQKSSRSTGGQADDSDIFADCREDENEQEENRYDESSVQRSKDPYALLDELIAFGSSKSVPNARSFLERRFDVLYVSPEQTITPVPSPRRTPHTSESERTSSEGDDMCTLSPNTQKSSRSTGGQADDSDIFADCREDENEQEENRYDESSVQKIVPQELVDNFMGMVLPGGMMDSDINRHCAHNFPAVAYTLGRANWPQLRDTYNKLATDDQLRVRVSIANSIHEMAAIVGARHTDDDLLPVFHAYREDAFEVRVGLLKHLFEFYRCCFQCLSPETRKGMIDALPQFMPMDNSMLNGNWRYRHEFAKQCNKLCEMYGIEEINRTMSAIALTLANGKSDFASLLFSSIFNRVSEVRKEAVHLLSQILARLVNHEWSDLTSKNESSVDGPSDATLTELFVNDLVNGFANTQKWTRRQTFAYVCERVLLDHALSMEQFRYFLLPHLIAMADDSVVNVRIAVCRALALCDTSLQSHAIASDSRRLSPLTVKTVLERLAEDADMDVSRAARQALGQTIGGETVDISIRGFRIREKENAFLDAHLVDNYEEDDMSLCSDYTSETSIRSTQLALRE
ncbi:hypothetical protein OESDEN_05846 [Oesophagostomum dentatum]|uniref:HEAT repeat protein n=1 Tax=Oesophagostomum dentatum TaxID=61180 RepID=A0A0B1TDQ0_OESDE|nr:hypothetical protein OESDEN_05846 [Oesophagostomum dentatum]